MWMKLSKIVYSFNRKLTGIEKLDDKYYQGHYTEQLKYNLFFGTERIFINFDFQNFFLYPVYHPLNYTPVISKYNSLLFDGANQFL